MQITHEDINLEFDPAIWNITVGRDNISLNRKISAGITPFGSGQIISSPTPNTTTINTADTPVEASSEPTTTRSLSDILDVHA